MSALERDVHEAADPILRFDPNANWTRCFNRLVELGPDALFVLARSPHMVDRCAPDDLGVLMHCSLLRTLIDDGTAPKPITRCLETVGDLLFFEMKVRGQSLGTPLVSADQIPRRWHDLFPGAVEHSLTDEIDADHERSTLCAWLGSRRQPGGVRITRRLVPQVESLWTALAVRYADVWEFEVHPAPLRCRSTAAGSRTVVVEDVSTRGSRWAARPPPPSETESAFRLAAQDLPPPPLLRIFTSDYNRARAACIWLGQSNDGELLEGIIARLDHPSSIVAYNARFALQFSPNLRIREALERYNRPAAPPTPSGELVEIPSPRKGVRSTCAGSNSCSCAPRPSPRLSTPPYTSAAGSCENATSASPPSNRNEPS